MSWREFARRLGKMERRFAPKVYKALKSMSDAFTDNLRNGNPTMAIGLNEQVGEVLRQMHIAAGLSEGRRTLSALKSEKRLGPSNEEWIAEIIDRLSFHNARFVNSISETTREWLLQQLQDGIAEGLSLNEIADRIDTMVVQTYRNRSFAIARTELVRASNMGTQMASEKYEYETQKVWMTASDHRVRGNFGRNKFNHVILDGVKVDSEATFNNGEDIRFPGDPEASPGNTINCRCTIAIIAKRDSEGNLIIKKPRLFFAV